MVRREKSPEVIEDVRLYVVWVPYPLNPNWVYEEDQQACAKWVAEVIGNEYYLISIHQKPSSRGMILLEISKEFTDHRRLLGEHQWCNFLKDAKKEEEGNKTCVYYSIYRTCREARKDGWNPISVCTKWFKAWSPGIGRFVSPYPEPSHCLLPPEDRTSKQICRHVPLAMVTKPTPTKANGPPVVGSRAWFAQQEADIPNSESTVENWRSQDKVNSSTIANFAATSSLLQAHTIGETSVLPQRSEASMTVLSRSKRKAVPLRKFMSQPQAPQTKVQAPAWVGRSTSSSSSSTGQKPPALGELPAKPENAWANPLKIVPLKPAKITTNPDSTGSWQSSHESWAEIVEDEMVLEASAGTTPDESTSPQVMQPLASTFNLKKLTSSLDEAESSPIPSYTTFQHSDDECDLEDILAPMGGSSNDSDNDGTTIPSNEFRKVPSKEPSGDKDWSTAWSDSEENSEKKKQEILCPTHGPACSKKICQDYQKLERERKWEEAKKNGQWRGRGRGRGRRGRWPFKVGNTSGRA